MTSTDAPIGVRGVLLPTPKKRNATFAGADTWSVTMKVDVAGITADEATELAVAAPRRGGSRSVIGRLRDMSPLPSADATLHPFLQLPRGDTKRLIRLRGKVTGRHPFESAMVAARDPSVRKNKTRT